jgi:hypothetical protein
MPGGSRPCRYLAEGGGCSIYERRPATCEKFFCEWRYGLGTDADRPDRIRAVPHSGGPYGARTIRLAVSPGTTPSEATRAFAQRLRDAGLRVVWVNVRAATLSDEPGPATVERAQVDEPFGR